MTRMQCRDCGLDRDIEWNGEMRCTGCGSSDVRVAELVADLSADLFERLRAALENLDDGPCVEE